MQPFDHFSPQSLSEAQDLLARLDGNARVMAGGTDLFLQMKAGELSPAAILNIKRLPELRGVSFSADVGLQMGALTTLGEVARLPLVRERYPCLAETAAKMASQQIRNLATVGGNLCNAAPSADLAPPLIALEATLHLVSAAGDRQLPAAAFFLGPNRSALAAGELLRAISVPAPQGETVYVKYAGREFMDLALVGVAARVVVADGVCRMCRIVLGAVAPTPIRAERAEALLEGKSLTPERIAEAARAAVEDCRPIDDVHASAWYRRRMVEVVTRRCLHALVATEPV